MVYGRGVLCVVCVLCVCVCVCVIVPKTNLKQRRSRHNDEKGDDTGHDSNDEVCDHKTSRKQTLQWRVTSINSIDPRQAR